MQRTFLWGDVRFFSIPSKKSSSLTIVFHQTVEVKSRHGLISDCSVQLTNTRITRTVVELINQRARSFLHSKRYGFLYEDEDTPQDDADPCTGGPHLVRGERTQLILDAKAWLQDALNSPFGDSS